jgi:hypothetical protein
MTKDTTTRAAVAADGLLFENWFDAIEDGVRARVRDFIETLLEEELAGALSRRRYGRLKPGEAEVPPPVIGVRHGRRERSLTGTFGRTKIRSAARLRGVPRVSSKRTPATPRLSGEAMSSVTRMRGLNSIFDSRSTRRRQTAPTTAATGRIDRIRGRDMEEDRNPEPRSAYRCACAFEWRRPRGDRARCLETSARARGSHLQGARAYAATAARRGVARARPAVRRGRTQQPFRNGPRPLSPRRGLPFLRQ